MTSILHLCLIYQTIKLNTMKYRILIFIFMFSSFLFAQDIEKDGKIYQVKKERIFLDGKDVTETLNLEDKTTILKKASIASEKIAQNKQALKDAEKLEKEKQKAEKAQKKAEKAQKKAEKALKQQQKAQSRLDKATKKLESSQKKFEKLKRKGKLSPQDEAKWLERLEGYQKDVERAKKKI